MSEREIVDWRQLSNFSAIYAAIRRKSKNWLALNQDNASELRDMLIQGLLFHWAKTINIHTSVLVQCLSCRGKVCSIQHYMVKFVSDLWQIGGFLYQYNWNIVERHWSFIFCRLTIRERQWRISVVFAYIVSCCVFILLDWMPTILPLCSTKLIK
jgi:hypothetical protein